MPVRDAGDRLGQSERGTVGLGEVPGLRPRGEYGDPISALAELECVARVHAQAEWTAVDLGDPDLDQLDELVVQTAAAVTLSASRDNVMSA